MLIMALSQNIDVVGNTPLSMETQIDVRIPVEQREKVKLNIDQVFREDEGFYPAMVIKPNKVTINPNGGIDLETTVNNIGKGVNRVVVHTLEANNSTVKPEPSECSRTSDVQLTQTRINKIGQPNVSILNHSYNNRTNKESVTGRINIGSGRVITFTADDKNFQVGTTSVQGVNFASLRQIVEKDILHTKNSSLDNAMELIKSSGYIPTEQEKRDLIDADEAARKHNTDFDFSFSARILKKAALLQLNNEYRA
jgi:hypothetical protein